ncbi:MAG TPA: hypothetical protein DEA22_13805 [Blastocatellia bacterium]|nr:hypothetical protein [Blastocatellia bacterium]
MLSGKKWAVGQNPGADPAARFGSTDPPKKTQKQLYTLAFRLIRFAADRTENGHLSTASTGYLMYQQHAATFFLKNII